MFAAREREGRGRERLSIRRDNKTEKRERRDWQRRIEVMEEEAGEKQRKRERNRQMQRRDDMNEEAREIERERQR